MQRHGSCARRLGDVAVFCPVAVYYIRPVWGVVYQTQMPGSGALTALCLVLTLGVACALDTDTYCSPGTVSVPMELGTRVPHDSSYWYWQQARQSVRMVLPVLVLQPVPWQLHTTVLFLGVLHPLPVLLLGPIKVLLPVPHRGLVNDLRQFNMNLHEWMETVTPSRMAPLIRHGLHFFKCCHAVSLLIARLDALIEFIVYFRSCENIGRYSVVYQ